MKRRHFLKAALASGALYSAGGLPIFGGMAHGSGFAGASQRIVVNMMLEGGPDVRHLLPPPFDPSPASYGYRFWEAKAYAHGIAKSPSAYQTRWENDYFHVASGETAFGILNTCGWLKRMWDSGHVALVNNALGCPARDHAYCQLIMDQGDRSSGPNDYERSGWGGRLASAGGGNVLALTKAPRRFCYGPSHADPYGHDNANLISAKNTRKISLFQPSATAAITDPKAAIARSLSSYYAAQRQEMPATSVYRRFVDMERSVRDFGDMIAERLASVPLPAPIEALFKGGLSNPYLGEQIRNLYDSLACADLLSLRVASMEFGNWDSHKDQRSFVEPKFEDLFGDGKAFDVLYQQLPADVANNMVFVLAGEFGRQLRANSGNGTDHGRGTTIMVIGHAVQGGVYGDMFPESELAVLDEHSSDIEGLTEIDHVFGRVCDWMVPGGSGFVFPNRGLAIMEPGVDLGGMLSV
jgi:uncharacterized protein (DUF1501 family)